MIVNMIFDKTRYLALMPANKISHNNGMVQLPLAISGKPFTTMKKALFHGRLRVFGEKMNTSVSLCSMTIANETQYFADLCGFPGFHIPALRFIIVCVATVGGLILFSIHYNQLYHFSERYRFAVICRQCFRSKLLLHSPQEKL